jgi:hypothetical protein
LNDNNGNITYRPATADFFSKTGGQFQFSVKAPNWREPESHGDIQVSWVDKSGAVFIEAASPDPSNPGRLNWKNGKIILALSDKDISQILFGVRTKQGSEKLVQILHTNADRSVTKTFAIRTGREGTWQLSLNQSGPNKISVNVYINGPDLLRLTSLLEDALPKVLGWDKA